MKNYLGKGLLLVSLMLTGCYYDVEEELYPGNGMACDTTNVTYSAHVEPIINSNCYTCHTGSAPSGNINLLGHANLSGHAQSGKLLGAITHAQGFTPMPQGGNKLSDCKIQTIRTWINKGMPNN